MKIVLDTNCFISCIGKRSPWRIVFDAFLKSKYTLSISADILLEYEEKFQQMWSEEVAANLLGTLLTAANTSFQPIFYNFDLVNRDADDNKFADAYLAAGADYLVSNDTALLALNKQSYPEIEVLTLQEFALLLGEKFTV